jgi:hypothetical protein
VIEAPSTNGAQWNFLRLAADVLRDRLFDRLVQGQSGCGPSEGLDPNQSRAGFPMVQSGS